MCVFEYVVKKILLVSFCGAILLNLNLSVVEAAVLFQDGFETGNLSHTESGITYQDSNYASGDAVSVSNERAYTGNHSLKFHFGGNTDLNDDAWAEQRMGLGGQKTEMWIQYYLYIPSNYYHRNATGASNNKFTAVYHKPYGPGFQVNLSTEPNGGDSTPVIHYYHLSTELSPIYGSGQVFTDANKGKWNQIIIHVKTPSGDTPDGIVELFVNGQKKIGVTNLNSYGGGGQNYFDELYLLGWSNSGFNEDTDMFIDDITMSTTSTGGTAPSAPSAPSATTPPSTVKGFQSE